MSAKHTLLPDLPSDLPLDQIAEFCTHWGIVEFALFGSVLRDDFGPDSDIDGLVSLAPDTEQTPDRQTMRQEGRYIPACHRTRYELPAPAVDFESGPGGLSCSVS